MSSERGHNDGRSWLHNMSVPSRSVLRCARAVLPGRRYLVDGLPRGTDSEAGIDGDRALHEYLAEYGMAALAALIELARAGRKVEPAKVRSRARKFRGDAAEAVERAIAQALLLAGVPTAIGVFLPAASVAGGSQSGRARETPLDPPASLAVLARRSGPLYVPARPVEPSLIVLERCVLVFPGPGERVEEEDQ
jgi:hypothetical protein